MTAFQKSEVVYQMTVVFCRRFLPAHGDRTVDQMTQAEKSQLRYVTIMNQLEYAMGDLSNTLNQPANQLRVLETAITKCARALGNIFIPLLNMILPLLISFANISLHLSS